MADTLQKEYIEAKIKSLTEEKEVQQAALQNIDYLRQSEEINNRKSMRYFMGVRLREERRKQKARSYIEKHKFPNQNDNHNLSQQKFFNEFHSRNFTTNQQEFSNMNY